MLKLQSERAQKFEKSYKLGLSEADVGAPGFDESFPAAKAALELKRAFAVVGAPPDAEDTTVADWG